MTRKRTAHIQSLEKLMILTVAPQPRCVKKDLPDFLFDTYLINAIYSKKSYIMPT
ncbi:hypothetical protein NTGHW29_140084 [Candidatus Nitrotoga sp. HW29]|nr:hypothetical protein NTGHW29_140084 [Candidatus Nitrotoga sp. HW29]